jgi:DNA-binding CsgD family transcriptional regulator
MPDALAPTAPLERFSAALLRLGALAHELGAAEFLERASEVLMALIPFSRGMWGMGVERGRGRLPAIHQAQYIGLPDSFAAEWLAVGLHDSFAERMRRRPGQVQRYDGAVPEPSPPEEAGVLAFSERHGLHHGMALRMEIASMGHGFFMILYRGPAEPAFDEGEAQLFALFLQHLLQLWHQRLQAALAAQAQAELAGAALVREDDGRLLFAGPALCELLSAAWPDWDGMTLPAPLLPLLRQPLPQRLRLAQGLLELRRSGAHLWLMRHEAGLRAPGLTPRRMQALQLFAAGHSYKETARQLGLTPATVRTYLRDAYLALGVSNKIELGVALRGRGGDAEGP